MRSKLSVALAINPKTGQQDLMGALHHVLECLQQEDNYEVGDLFDSIPGALLSRLNNFGIPDAYRGDFALIMQETGIARRLGRNVSQRWEFISATFLDAMLTEQVLNKSLRAIEKRRQKNKDFLKLKRGKNLDSDNGSGPSVETEKLLNNLAEAATAYEKLQVCCDGQRQEIGHLENRLSKVVETDVGDVAEALMAKFR